MVNGRGMSARANHVADARVKVGGHYKVILQRQ